MDDLGNITGSQKPRIDDGGSYHPRAFIRLYRLERAARVQLDAMSLGDLQVMQDAVPMLASMLFWNWKTTLWNSSTVKNSTR